MNILKQIERGESKTIEFKEKLPKNNSIVKTVIAFSNTSGGKLIIGVSDDKKIVGILDEDIFTLQDKIISLIFDSCHPNILPEIYTINVEGKILLVIEIFRGNLLPYYFKSKGKIEGTYVRVGSSNRLTDEKMLAELERQRIHRSFDEEANLEHSLEDLELETIYDAFLKIGKVCDVEKLKNLKLITSLNDKYVSSNALLIALGKLDNVQIKCARFKGTTMESFIDKKEFDGTLFEILEKSMKFLQNHLHLSATIEGLQRTESYEIPMGALREIILNAIIHRDYTRNSDIKIAIYDDIVEIISIGGLVNGLTIDDIGNGRSELRNKVLANLFRELGYIESWGSGIGRVRTVCQEAGVNFVLREKGSFVEAVFHRNTVETEPKNTKTVDYGRLRSIIVDSHRSIAEYIVENEQITRKTTMELLGIGRTKADEILSSMLTSGFIVRKGAGRATHYVLAPQMNMENG
jgi:ATP-dependent DNA helicase RecG